jgi:hypothetical protein
MPQVITMYICPKCLRSWDQLHSVIIDNEHIELCESCIGNNEIDYMDANGHIGLYLYWKDAPILNDLHRRIPSHVSNWINKGMRFDVVAWKYGKHNMCCHRIDVWFMHKGVIWWGCQIGDMDFIRCRRTKRTKI